MVSVFKRMESNREQLGVINYSVSQTILEQASDLFLMCVSVYPHPLTHQYSLGLIKTIVYIWTLIWHPMKIVIFFLFHIVRMHVCLWKWEWGKG